METIEFAGQINARDLSSPALEVDLSAVTNVDAAGVQLLLTLLGE